jgi:hypothetical protein
MWHDAGTWQTLRVIWEIPLGSALGAILMAAQIAGGLGLCFPRTARIASIVLMIVYGAFCLTCVPPFIKAPKANYDSFFEQLSMLCGAIAVYAASDPNIAQVRSLVTASRIGLGLSAVSFTVTQAIYLHETADLVPKWIPPNQMFWSVLTTVAFALAAIAILINRRAHLAMQLMALMTGLFGLLVWVPILFAAPQSHLSWSEFAITMLITGATLAVADVTPADANARRRDDKSLVTQ